VSGAEDTRAEDPRAEDPRAVLRRHGLHAKRALSQNFLVNRGAVEKIAVLAAQAPVRRVVEIGPGLGTLTAALLARGVEVVAVERDPEMCAVLAAELGSDPGLTIAAGDALDFDFSARVRGLPAAVCGNLPYAITGPLLRRFSDLDLPGLRFVVMVQLEVAQRMLAPAGDRRRGGLSAMLDARFEMALAMKLSPGSFHPRPKVSSAVVVMRRRAGPLPGVEDLALFDRAVKAAFSSRRKTLRNSLSSGLSIPAERAETLCREAGIDPGARAETLETAAFAALAARLRENGF
jgi:16S rRNA (adenine1518-N6/adenine1519-N6)-dimethyltransferase